MIRESKPTKIEALGKPFVHVYNEIIYMHKGLPLHPTLPIGLEAVHSTTICGRFMVGTPRYCEEGHCE